MTTKLSDTQRILLERAITDNGGRLSDQLLTDLFPKLRGAAVRNIITALSNRKLVAYDEMGCYVTETGHLAVDIVPTTSATDILASTSAPPRKAWAQSKQATVIRLLQRPEGVTIAEICAETNWQAHTARGFLAGAVKKRLGLTLASRKEPGSDRCYYIA